MKRMERMNVPVFGATDAQPVIDRPAAYALLRTNRGVAVVLAEDGRLFLPGGGLLDGESPEEAVMREVMEECGLAVLCDKRYAEAVQYFTARDGRHYRSHMVFVICCAKATGTDAGFGEHTTLWLTEMPAQLQFAHAAHAWALRTYVGPRRSRPPRRPRG
jgi:8-oxo-dGTP diphosphatase